MNTNCLGEPKFKYYEKNRKGHNTVVSSLALVSWGGGSSRAAVLVLEAKIALGLTHRISMHLDRVSPWWGQVPACFCVSLLSNAADVE